jgi:class 3 adenylate cyclase
LTLLFADIVDSTKNLGDREAVPAIQRHHVIIREILGHFSEGEEIESAGELFLPRHYQTLGRGEVSRCLCRLGYGRFRLRLAGPVFDRIGIHVGEVWIEEHEGAGKAQDLYGLQVDICARVESLGQADQILVSRFPWRRTPWDRGPLLAQSRSIPLEGGRGDVGNLRSR